MKVVGIAGWKNSGKTGLVVRLIGEFRSRGVRVSSVKHSHHSFDIDTPGTDSFRHREAGAGEVLIASDRHWALMHSNETSHNANLFALIDRLEPVDVVLVEGFKRWPIAKIEVRRRVAGGRPLQPDDDRIAAVVSDHELGDLPVPVFDLDAVAAVADFILQDIHEVDPDDWNHQ